MLAKDGGTHTVGGKTFSVTVVDGENNSAPIHSSDKDYSYIIGKWAKYWLKDHQDKSELCKWWEIEDVKWGLDSFLSKVLTIKVKDWPTNGYTYNDVLKGINNETCCFDLDNLMDYNPDELQPQKQEQPTPDYSHLVGKWVKCIFSPITVKYIVGKYYKCTGLDEMDGTPIFFNEGEINKESGWADPKRYFDIDHPLPYNPDTRIPLPEGVEFVEVAGVDYFRMNENQCLAYSESNATYFVTTRIPRSDNESYHLEPCLYGEVKEGEWFVFNNLIYLLTPQGCVRATRKGTVLIDDHIKNPKTPVHRVVRTNNN